MSSLHARVFIAATLNDDSLTLVVAVGSSNCDRFGQVEGAETDTAVTITAVVSEKETGLGLLDSGCKRT